MKTKSLAALKKWRKERGSLYDNILGSRHVCDINEEEVPFIYEKPTPENICELLEEILPVNVLDIVFISINNRPTD